MNSFFPPSITDVGVTNSFFTRRRCHDHVEWFHPSCSYHGGDGSGSLSPPIGIKYWMVDGSSFTTNGVSVSWIFRGTFDYQRPDRSHPKDSFALVLVITRLFKLSSSYCNSYYYNCSNDYYW